MLGKINAALNRGRPNTHTPSTGSVVGTQPQTVEPTAHALPEATTQTIEHLRVFCQLWRQDLETPGSFSVTSIQHCFRESAIDTHALHARLPADLQAELADLIAQSCRKWAAGGRVSLIFALRRLSTLPLTTPDPKKLTPLNDLLFTVIQEHHRRAHFNIDELISAIRDLQAMLPQASRERLQRQIEDYVKGELGKPENQRANMDILLTAIECIDGAKLRASFLLSCLEALAQKKGWPDEDDQQISQCLRSLVKLTPDLPPESWPQFVGRFNQVNIEQEIDRRTHCHTWNLLNAIKVANGAVACLGGSAHQKAQAMDALLSPSTLQTVECLAMAVRLADHSNSEVGLLLHHFIRLQTNEDGRTNLRFADSAKLAVLSFHVDPGDATHFEIEADGGPQRVDYPDWLVDMRQALSAGWTELRSSEQSAQYFATNSATKIAHPALDVLIAQYAGPRVTCADWPALEKHLEALHASGRLP